MSAMKELAFRLQGCGSELEARRIEVEFVAERANSPEVVGWYACALDGEVIDRLSIRCFGPPPVRLSVIVRLDPSKPDGFAVYPSQYDDCALGAGGALGVCRAHFKEADRAGQCARSRTVAGDCPCQERRGAD